MEPLDNPVWHALHGPHRTFAETAGGACRYDPDVSPFAALPDDPTDDDWEALRTLTRTTAAVLVRPEGELSAVQGADDGFGLQCLQMIATAPIDRPTGRDDVTPFELGADDVDDMLGLIAHTRPGPFRARTRELGRYLGIRDPDGALIAMSGERMHLTGASELSAVCTRPDHRGRGLADLLVRAIAAGIQARDELPILHVATENVVAIRLYERLGFTVRATLDVLGVGGDGQVTGASGGPTGHGAPLPDVS